MWDFDFSDLLNTSITVNRKTATLDAAGRETDTFAAVYTAIPALVQPVSLEGIKEEFAGGLQMQATHRIYSNQVLAMHDGDQIVDANGVKYRFEFMGTQGGTGEVFAIYCTLITE